MLLIATEDSKDFSKANENILFILGPPEKMRSSVLIKNLEVKNTCWQGDLLKTLLTFEGSSVQRCLEVEKFSQRASLPAVNMSSTFYRSEV